MQNLVYPQKILPNGAATETTLSTINSKLVYDTIHDGIQTTIAGFKSGALSIDAFSRLRVSNPVGIFDAQFTYDLQPVLYEQITNGSGATVTHDATNRVAVMTFSSTPTGGKAIMQSYEFIPYQPGKSQLVYITFNLKEGVANCIKFAGLSDGLNGFEFRLNGTTKQLCILSTTEIGNQIIDQANWNLDKLDGTGESGKTLDISKIQFLAIDFQALYSGRVRFGFDLDGVLYFAHEFDHANEVINTYIAYASLPIRIGMTCTGTVSTTMNFNCCAVSSEGGREETTSYHFTAPDSSVVAASGARTHLLSIRPKATFNSKTNRIKLQVESVDIVNTGTKTIYWELVIGQAISGSTAFTDVNTTYAAMEYNNTGTISGSPAVVIDSGYVIASNQIKTSISKEISSKFPLTLDASGSSRSLGTVSILVTGIGGTSDCRGVISWKGYR